MKKLLCAVLAIGLLMCSTISAGIAESYTDDYNARCDLIIRPAWKRAIE